MAGLTSLTKRLEKVESALSETRISLKNLPQAEKVVAPLLSAIEDRLVEKIKAIKFPQKNYDDDIKDIEKDIEALRRILSSYNAGHAGNANRNIQIGGAEALRPYTDINLLAGSNVTITYTANNATKYTDVTVAATGGSGTVRSVNTIAINTAAGSTAGTDYVYIGTQALTLTLPATVGNTNLYTVKNTSTGIITIATTGGDTIDTNTSIQLSTQYTSVDIISDGVSNWNLT